MQSEMQSTSHNDFNVYISAVCWLHSLKYDKLIDLHYKQYLLRFTYLFSNLFEHSTRFKLDTRIHARNQHRPSTFFNMNINPVFILCFVFIASTLIDFQLPFCPTFSPFANIIHLSQYFFDCITLLTSLFFLHGC